MEELRRGRVEASGAAAISDWQAIKLVAPLLYVAVFLVVYLSWWIPSNFGFVVAGLATTAVITAASAVNRWIRGGMRSKIVAEQPSAEVLVAVYFELGPAEYGQDIGHLSFLDGWLYFEGERSSFSLSPQDFTCRWRSGGGISTSLDLTTTWSAVAIRIESMSLTDSKLRGSIEGWVMSTAPVDGITVLPPLKARTGVTYTLIQQSRIRVVLILGALVGILIDGFLNTQFTLGIAILALTIASLLGIYRACVVWQWKSAILELEKARARVESSSPKAIETNGTARS